MKRPASRFCISVSSLGVLFAFGLPIAAQTGVSRETLHARMMAGQQIAFDLTASENTRTIDAAWIKEAALRHVDINLYGAVIRDDLPLQYITFEAEVQLGKCVFEKYVDFGFTNFKRNFHSYGTTFRGGASFESATFYYDAFFGGTEFDDVAWFQDAHVVKFFEASSTKFVKGKTASRSNFSRARFDSGAAFSFATFDTDADFSAAQFGEKAEFWGTQFHGAADFQRAHFAGAASFGDGKLISTFGGGTKFNAAHFDSSTWFVGVTFQGNSEFVDVRFGADVFFQGASFNGDTFFHRSQIVGTALFRSETDLPATSFKKRAQFDYARFESDAQFNGTSFEGPTSFHETTCHVVYFSPIHKGSTTTEQTAQFGNTLEFRGFTYDRIYASWKDILDKSEVYDRQPYTQLEKVLRSLGQDDEADKVYLERKRRERREVIWRQSKISWFLDWAWFLVANYGILSFPWQLFVFPVVSFSLAALAFRRPGAVLCAPRRFTVVDAVRLSLRVFLPFEVPLGASWTPSDHPIDRRVPVRYSDIAALLKILGWVYVPLWVAVLAGVFRYAPSK